MFKIFFLNRKFVPPKYYEISSRSREGKEKKKKKAKEKIYGERGVIYTMKHLKFMERKKKQKKKKQKKEEYTDA